MPVLENHTELEEQVIRTLLYFDIFGYPLKAVEVFTFLHIRSSQKEVTRCLDHLADKKRIFRFGDLYSLHAGEKDIKRRLKGNAEAEKWLKVAEKKARFIGKFPFVRAVMASGSLSKGYMDESSDLDFFIVTVPKRLWLARTLLVLYKRIFLANSHKQFCVNYFIDTAHLEIEEKNLFTATELASLIPLYNRERYESLIVANDWLPEFFPNFSLKKFPKLNAMPSHPLRAFFESLLYPVSDMLDKFFMQMTLRRWCNTYGDSYSKTDFDIAFKTRRHVSKNHPNNYQKKVLEMYKRRLTEYKNQFGQLTAYE